MILKASNIQKKYGSIQVLKGVDIEVAEGEIVSIVGSSGAGKSTLLHILGTLDKPDSGQLEICGTALHQLSPKDLAQFRNKHIGFVFQFHHLLPEFTALENVSIPGWIAGKKHSEVEQHAKTILAELGLSERLQHKPGELSGGEQQRVAIARAMLNKPNIIFADEPTGNLDSGTAHEFHTLLFKLRKEFGQTFLLVTHNEELAGISDRIIHMKDGRISSLP